MRESRDGTKTPKSVSPAPFPLILDIDDFKGEFSFDALFGNLVSELLLSFKVEEAKSKGNDSLPNGHLRVPSDATKYSQGISTHCSRRLRSSCLCSRIHVRSWLSCENRLMGDSTILRKTFLFKTLKHRKTLGESADAQREFASQTIELIKYLMEFNSSPGDLMELSPLFSYDSHVAKATSIAQKLHHLLKKILEDKAYSCPISYGKCNC